MVDNLLYQRAMLGPESSEQVSAWRARLEQMHGGGHERGHYGVVTLHRPANVDAPETLARLIGVLREIADHLPLAFPVHPRTQASIAQLGLNLGPNILVLPPLPYMAFLDLWKDAAVVLTDSGGLQEETTALGVPCVTLRENTERPITLTKGSNVLAGTDPERIRRATQAALARPQGGAFDRPALWDGRAAIRIVEHLAVFLR
jgi:UDP-N-acetylglucosamine 2-epimerase (non-hydrolysing)